MASKYVEELSPIKRDAQLSRGRIKRTHYILQFSYHSKSLISNKIEDVGLEPPESVRYTVKVYVWHQHEIEENRNECCVRFLHFIMCFKIKSNVSTKGVQYGTAR